LKKKSLWELERARILSELERRGITKSQLAVQMGLDRQAVGNWLKGGRIPSADSYLDLLAALNALKGKIK